MVGSGRSRCSWASGGSREGRLCCGALGRARSLSGPHASAQIPLGFLEFPECSRSEVGAYISSWGRAPVVQRVPSALVVASPCGDRSLRHRPSPLTSFREVKSRSSCSVGFVNFVFMVWGRHPNVFFFVCALEVPSSAVWTSLLAASVRAGASVLQPGSDREGSRG